MFLKLKWNILAQNPGIFSIECAEQPGKKLSSYIKWLKEKQAKGLQNRLKSVKISKSRINPIRFLPPVRLKFGFVEKTL